MRIERKKLIDDLDRFARSGNGILTGAPGVGKTHSILELHTRWVSEEIPHLLVPVDRIGSATDEEIRALMGIDTDLLTFASEQLQAEGKGQGVLVFDAFDAARSEVTRERVLELIRRAVALSGSQWTVLVSVRLYDAERSAALRMLFPQNSGDWRDLGERVDRARRFEVPLLNEVEVESAIAQVPGLSELAATGTSDFRTLLIVPFNLWLLSKILSVPGSNRPISTVSSEVQLLALYWKRRVLGATDPEKVRHLLERAVTKMVEASSLSIRRDEIFTARLSGAWAEALSSGVLAPTDTTEQRVAFGHNILFDYAVSVLLLEDDAGAMHRFIASDPARPFFLRPSISFYFTRLWYDARPSFWLATWATSTSRNPHVRLVGRIVPSATIVLEARSINDLGPLLQAIDRGEDNARDVLLRVFQALRAHPYSFVAVWAELAAEAIDRPDRRYLWNAITFAADLLERNVSPGNGEVRRFVGRGARQALKWALEQRKTGPDRFIDGVGGLWAVPLIAQTFDTDPTESASLLRRVLALLDEGGFPIEYIRHLTNHLGALASHDPQLVIDIYESVFSHAEESEQETHFGTPILPLRSTRRQDFGMCEYALVKEFDEFLATAPRHAVEAAMRCVNAYVLSKRVVRYMESGKSVNDLTEPIEFRQLQAQVIGDLSAIWAQTPHQDEPMKLLDKVMNRLTKAALDGDTATVDMILDQIGSHGHVGVIWRALIEKGALHPQTIGPKLAELSLAPILQRSMYHDLVKFIESSSPFWTADQRAKLERSIIGMRKDFDQHPERGSRRVVDLFAHALPRELLTNRELIATRAELESAGGRPANEPPVAFTMTSKEFTTEDWLEEQGVDVLEPTNRELMEAEKKLVTIETEFRNKRATIADVDRIARTLRETLPLLTQYESQGAPEVLELVRTKTAAVAGLIAQAQGDTPEDALELAKEVLLNAATETPSNSEEPELEYRHPGWSPNPQTEAAEALAWLAVRGLNGPVIEAIENQSRSRRPPVRYLTALELFRLHKHTPKRFWQLAAEISEREANEVVLSGLLQSLGRFRKDAGKTAGILARLEQRGFAKPDDRSELAEVYARLLAWLALNVEEKWAVERFNKHAHSPLDSGKLIQRLSFEALTVVTADYLQDKEIRPISLRAVRWLRELMAAVTAALPNLKQPDATAADAGVKSEILYGIVDDVAARLYYQARPGNKIEGEADPLTLTLYYETVRPLIEDVIAFGKHAEATLLAHTAHHLMELLHLCVAIDPRGVLRLAADVAQASEQSGYNLDSMAVGEVVEIAEVLLADFRHELAHSQSMEDFVRLLDTFASAGWPDALRLLWRLDEVFR